MFWRHMVEPRATVSPTVIRVLGNPSAVSLPPLPAALDADGWRDVLVLHPTQDGRAARLDLDTPAGLYDLLRELPALRTWRHAAEGLSGRYHQREITHLVREAADRRWLIVLARKTAEPLNLTDFLDGSGLLLPEQMATLFTAGTSLATADGELLTRTIVERGWVKRTDAAFIKRLYGMTRWRVRPLN